MSTAELATDELRRERMGIAEKSANEKRSDFYDHKREEIQRAIGIDPTKGGEFTCSKCKGTKTSFYEKQTRSSDGTLRSHCNAASSYID
jgi:DNA-directed RNA polymerase subunit M/transcription elongation factor TFIIS